MAITLVQAQAKLDIWLAAEEACAAGQRYEIEVEGNRRMLQRSDLAEIAKRIEYWNSKVTALSRRASGASRSRFIVN